MRARVEEAVRVLNAGLARSQGELGVEVVFILVDRQQQGLGLVDSIVEYGGRGQVGEEVAAESRHCALRGMNRNGDVKGGS